MARSNGLSNRHDLCAGSAGPLSLDSVQTQPITSKGGGSWTESGGHRTLRLESYQAWEFEGEVDTSEHGI